jgi:hypothetical protein
MLNYKIINFLNFSNCLLRKRYLVFKNEYKHYHDIRFKTDGRLNKRIKRLLRYNSIYG